MTINVTQQLTDTKPLLLQKIESNPDLAGVLLALLGRLVLECTARGYKINGVMMGELHEKDGRFGCHISYTETSLLLPVRIEQRTDFFSYMSAKNIALARVLQVNRGIERFFEKLIMRIDQYCMHKSIPFNELKVITNGAFISKDNELVITVGKEDTGVTKSRGFKSWAERAFFGR